MSKVPLMDYKNAMFQHSTDGFIYWKEEVDQSRLHNLLISMRNSSPEAIREINNKLGLLYTADALAQLESQDKEAAEKMRALKQKQADKEYVNPAYASRTEENEQDVTTDKEAIPRATFVRDT